MTIHRTARIDATVGGDSSKTCANPRRPGTGGGNGWVQDSTRRGTTASLSGDQRLRPAARRCRVLHRVLADSTRSARRMPPSASASPRGPDDRHREEARPWRKVEAWARGEAPAEYERSAARVPACVGRTVSRTAWRKHGEQRDGRVVANRLTTRSNGEPRPVESSSSLARNWRTQLLCRSG
jgi:hypothetical protein